MFCWLLVFELELACSYFLVEKATWNNLGVSSENKLVTRNSHYECFNVFGMQLQIISE